MEQIIRWMCDLRNDLRGQFEREGVEANPYLTDASNYDALLQSGIDSHLDRLLMLIHSVEQEQASQCKKCPACV